METTLSTSIENKPVTEDINFWQHHIEALQSSGLSRAKYCKHYEVNYDRFGYWLKRLSPSLVNTLIPIQLTSTSHELKTSVNDTLCTLQFKNGHCLQIHDEKMLIRILEHLN
ncbi:MAG: hypothetical protein AB7R69_06205 [Candidatus Babeliales bacterium]